jgi:hypothetical protein
MIKVKQQIREFQSALDSAANLFSAVEPYVHDTYDGIHTNPLHPSQARMVVGLSFLRVISAWESFLEEVFIRYLCGAKTENGYCPERILSGCNNTKNALQIIAGDPEYNNEKGYLSWSDYRTVEKGSRLYFREGKPFTEITDYEKQMIKECCIIRNRIAHSSEKCKAAFIKLAKIKEGVGTLKSGYSVGRFLIDNRNGMAKNCIGTNRYECYLNQLHDIAYKIVR